MYGTANAAVVKYSGAEYATGTGAPIGEPGMGMDGAWAPSPDGTAATGAEARATKDWNASE